MQTEDNKSEVAAMTMLPVVQPQLRCWTISDRYQQLQPNNSTSNSTSTSSSSSSNSSGSGSLLANNVDTTIRQWILPRPDTVPSAVNTFLDAEEDVLVVEQLLLKARQEHKRVEPEMKRIREQIRNRIQERETKATTAKTKTKTTTSSMDMIDDIKEAKNTSSTSSEMSTDSAISNCVPQAMAIMAQRNVQHQAQLEQAQEQLQQPEQQLNQCLATEIKDDSTRHSFVTSILQAYRAQCGEWKQQHEHIQWNAVRSRYVRNNNHNSNSNSNSNLGWMSTRDEKEKQWRREQNNKMEEGWKAKRVQWEKKCSQAQITLDTKQWTVIEQSDMHRQWRQWLQGQTSELKQIMAKHELHVCSWLMRDCVDHAKTLYLQDGELRAVSSTYSTLTDEREIQSLKQYAMEFALCKQLALAKHPEPKRVLAKWRESAIAKPSV